MAKSKKTFVCNECGAEHNKWSGQCSSCDEWNTIVEFRVPSESRGDRTVGYAGVGASAVQLLSEIAPEDLPRIPTGMVEFDRVLGGGGLVPGSAILIGGNPGAGKSTILLQTMCYLAQSLPALYVTGEESLQQVAMRARRLQVPLENLQLLAETNIHVLLDHVRLLGPKVLVIDSIQVLYNPDLPAAPGSVSQVRDCAALLTRFAKQSGTVLFLVGHVTKDGQLAGPKVLEHIIDCSIMLESSDDSRFRTLRGHKNRFGAVNELGVFAMTEDGMREVKNPSAIFLTRGNAPSSGSVVMVVWEGTRPLLVEIQALVDETQNPNPKRLAVGIEQNRLAMLLAVLHRHAGLRLGDQDVFVNVVGGLKVLETSADLALQMAIVSSFRERTLPQDLVVFGEVGLSGEIRPVPSGQERIHEAAKHGFRKAIVPRLNAPKQIPAGMEVVLVCTIEEAIAALSAEFA